MRYAILVMTLMGCDHHTIESPATDATEIQTTETTEQITDLEDRVTELEGFLVQIESMSVEYTCEDVNSTVEFAVDSSSIVTIELCNLDTCVGAVYYARTEDLMSVPCQGMNYVAVHQLVPVQ